VGLCVFFQFDLNEFSDFYETLLNLYTIKGHLISLFFLILTSSSNNMVDAQTCCMVLTLVLHMLGS